MAKIVSAGEVISRKYKLKKASDLNKGSAGIDGRHGYDGKVGPQGPAGPASKDGHDGHDGVDGSGFHWRGSYKPDNSYTPNDVVHYNGSSYICIKAAKAKPPSGSREYWDIMVEAGSHGGAGGAGPAGATGETGAGAAVTKGTEVLDFGSGSKTSEVVVTGITSVASDSIITPSVSISVTGDHSTCDLLTDPIRLAIKDLVVGVGFTIYGEMDNAEANGTYNINWYSV